MLVGVQARRVELARMSASGVVRHDDEITAEPIERYFKSGVYLLFVGRPGVL